MYRGYDIHEMAEKASFEEVAYLLVERRTAERRCSSANFTQTSSQPSARCRMRS